MITKDLNYTQYTNGDGVFSVSTSGTNLTHKWYKNDKLINSTGAGILAFGNDALTIEDSNGLLRITYEASNVDYDNMTQTTRQTFGLYINMTTVSQRVNCVNTTREIIINGNMTTAACNQVPIIVLAVSLPVVSFCLFVVCIILSSLLYRSCNRTIQSGQELRHYCNKMSKSKDIDGFLHCLTMILMIAKCHKKFKKECSSIFSDLKRFIEKYMDEKEQKVSNGEGQEEIEPQERDGGRVAFDDNSKSLLFMHIITALL